MPQRRDAVTSVVLVERHFGERALRHPLLQNGLRPSVIALTPAAVELFDKHREDASSLRRFDNDRRGCRQVGNDARASGGR